MFSSMLRYVATVKFRLIFDSNAQPLFHWHGKVERPLAHLTTKSVDDSPASTPSYIARTRSFITTELFDSDDSDIILQA
jgi:hypothetical protein